MSPRPRIGQSLDAPPLHGGRASVRRAVLERAFRGELVAQDPSDEPAETLPARIRAGHAAAPAPRREIVDDLEAALAELSAVAERLGGREP